MDNDFVKRISDLESEVTALKTAKDKASSLIEMVEYPLEIELEIYRNSDLLLESNMILVNTISENGTQPLVSMYYGGDDQDGRILEFARHTKNPLYLHENEMGFVVYVVRFTAEDGKLGPTDRKTTTVPLKIVSTGPVQITVEEYQK